MTGIRRTGLVRVVMGSVAEQAVHHSSVPVLLLRAHEDSALRFQEADEAGALRILVPLDGSPLAETVLAPVHALALALTTSRPVEMHLMLVVAPYVDMPENMPDGLIVGGANAYLERTAQRLRLSNNDGRLTVTWSVVAHGDIAHAIVSAAETKEASDKGGCRPYYDLVAMATHGRGKSFITRLALGSVTDRVLHQSKLPLLVVRPREATKPTSDPGVQIDS
jgi:nucleotide-binding universal stress UspA family protein